MTARGIAGRPLVAAPPVDAPWAGEATARGTHPLIGRARALVLSSGVVRASRAHTPFAPAGPKLLLRAGAVGSDISLLALVHAAARVWGGSDPHHGVLRNFGARDRDRRKSAHVVVYRVVAGGERSSSRGFQWFAFTKGVSVYRRARAGVPGRSFHRGSPKPRRAAGAWHPRVAWHPGARRPGERSTPGRAASPTRQTRSTPRAHRRGHIRYRYLAAGALRPGGHMHKLHWTTTPNASGDNRDPRGQHTP